MEKLYNRIDFVNGTTPALNDSNLNAISKAIDDIDDRIINLPVVIGAEAIAQCEDAAERAEEAAAAAQPTEVIVDAIRTTGTHIADITVDGEKTELYAPTGGGGGGTSDYNDLSNQPQINSVTLSGNKTLADLGIASASDLEDLSDIVGTVNTVLEGV